MIIRSIDSTGDWNLGRGRQSYKYDDNAIAENVQTRLLSWAGDCFFDLAAGIDWRRLMGEKNTQVELELSVRALILQSYGVVRVNSIYTNLNRTTRSILLQYDIATIFSPSVVNTVGV